VLVDKQPPGKLRATWNANIFFSGAAVYATRENLHVVNPSGFAIKLPEESRNTFDKNRCKTASIFSKGPVKKDYVVLPKAV